MSDNKPLGITELVLRDAHQSLLATRMRIEDMLPIAEKLDKVGFRSIESWGGATFDACIRYLGEDPWERIRRLKAAMPNTPQQMLFRGQNILGYRHYADDLVRKFVERCAVNGVDVFRIFDAMNDLRNLETAIKAALATAPQNNLVLMLGIILMAFGMLFKVAAVPFHVWSPDAYEGAVTPATTFMAVVVKAAAFGVLIPVLLPPPRRDPRGSRRAPGCAARRRAPRALPARLGPAPLRSKRESGAAECRALGCSLR